MTSTENTQRVAIVTGASRGIGRQSAIRLAQDGFAVVINYAGNDKAAQETVDAITSAGGRAVAVAGDVADEKAMAEVFDLAEHTFGGVDVVVNAAGQMILGPVVDYDLADFDRVHRTNVRGTFVVDQQAARRVRAGGAIINFSTSVVRTSFPNYAAYVSSKSAVEGLTLILARELRGRDITVNAIAPGPTATDLFLDGKTEEQVRASAKAVPLERLGQAGDIAEAVAFVASPAGHWVNGQNIPVNGGLA